MCTYFNMYVFVYMNTIYVYVYVCMNSHTHTHTCTGVSHAAGIINERQLLAVQGAPGKRFFLKYCRRASATGSTTTVACVRDTSYVVTAQSKEVFFILNAYFLGSDEHGHTYLQRVYSAKQERQ